MCDAITMAITTFALGAGQAVAGHMGQQAAADEQDRVFEENRRNALQAFGDKNAQLNMRASQEAEAAANEKFDAGLEARAARASSLVAAGESGISGLTVESLLSDVYGQEGRFRERVDTNLDWSMQQLEMEKRGQAAATRSQINSVSRGTRPNAFATGLQIGTAGLNAYTGYKKATEKKTS